MDWDGWAALTKKIGGKVQLVGDDIFVTNPSILKEGIAKGIANAILMAHRAGYAARDRPSSFRHLRFAVIFLLALVVVSVMGNRSLLRLYQMHRDQAALEREIDQVTSANAALAEKVRGLRPDPARVEAIAREELGLIKPGELVYEFRPVSPAPAQPGGSR